MAVTEKTPLRSEHLERFKVILDEPAEKLGASFDVYAEALADIIVHSKPQFAIGIFGDWGSGKTTLMQAIRTRVAGTEAVVPVWFNAWRYEREEHLIVPLLDTLRAELVAWAGRDAVESGAAEGARKAARVVGRAARALLAGLSLNAGLPGLGVGLDGGQALEAFEAKGAEEATSFYFASFAELQHGLAEFFSDGDRRRVVVFIDDLDRCLPHSALQVLESMKLFFDLEGFVFVVGLDQGVIERSIETKYQQSAPIVVVERERAEAPRPGSPPPLEAGSRPTLQGPPAAAAPISGAEYVKKIFQVPFSLPRISTKDLAQFFEELLDNAGLEAEQRTHLSERLGPHLPFLSGESAVNPRELKRMVNAYTVQSKMLNRKLDDFDPDVLVALLTTAFRTEWRRTYDTLVENPDGFVQDLSGIMDPSPASSAGERVLGEAVSAAFLDYVRGPGAALLARDLAAYISSVESAHTGDPAIAAALKIVRRLRTTLNAMERDPDYPDFESALQGDVELLRSEMSRASASGPAAEDVVRLAGQLAAGAGLGLRSADRTAFFARLSGILDRIYDDLRELRRQTTIGAAS